MRTECSTEVLPLIVLNLKFHPVVLELHLHVELFDGYFHIPMRRDSLELVKQES